MTASKQFQRRTEDFTCERCGYFVTGTGYTNHCPKCLWSKHVDVNPGDRLATCGGRMEPVGIHLDAGEYAILHRCITCGHEKWNKASNNDDVDLIIELSSRPMRHKKPMKGDSLSDKRYE
jgi:hypothetical protein